MKKTMFILTAFLLATVIILAQPPAGNAKKGTSYGIKVTSAGAVSPDAVTALLDGKDSASVTVKGEVASVCAHRGCFVYIKTASGKMYVKTRDDAFFVPLSLKGKKIIIKGTALKDASTGDLYLLADGFLVI
jgi:uncharacterized protein YdeI (BOF family)